MKEYTEIFEIQLTKNIDFFTKSKAKGYKDVRNVCEITFVEILQQKVQFLIHLKGIKQRIKQLKSKMSKQQMVILICQDFIEGKFGDLKKIQ